MASTPQPAATNTNGTAYVTKPPRTSGKLSLQTRRRKKNTFLKTYGTTLSVSASAEAAGIERHTHYDWLDSDPDYARRFSEAEGRTLDHAEREVFSRGVVGWDEPVFHQGEIVGHIKRKSDTCLLFYLKCRGKGRWNDRLTVEGPLGALLDGVQVAFVRAAEAAAPAIEHKQLEAPEQESATPSENE